MLVGYARVSTSDQIAGLEAQQRELNGTGCTKIFSERVSSVAQRDESTVPAQSLFLMNSPWIVEQSRHAAQRLLAETSLDEAGRVTRIFQRAFARSPTPEELTRSLRYLTEPESLATNPQAAPPTTEQLRLERWTSYCQTLFASGEFRTLR